jgi:hypothetical protein
MDPVSIVAMAAGLPWASGIRLYAVVFISGALHAGSVVTLPAGLQVLAEPIVLVVAGGLLLAEFFADKIPGFDTLWDAVHTFIRIPRRRAARTRRPRTGEHADCRCRRTARRCARER